MVSDIDRSADELRADIERTRGELARTVDAIAAKVDVPAQLKARATALRTHAPDTARALGGQVRQNPGRTAAGAAAGVGAAALWLWRRKR